MVSTLKDEQRKAMFANIHRTKRIRKIQIPDDKPKIHFKKSNITQIENTLENKLKFEIRTDQKKQNL